MCVFSVVVLSIFEVLYHHSFLFAGVKLFFLLSIIVIEIQIFFLLLNTSLCPSLTRLFEFCTQSMLEARSILPIAKTKDEILQSLKQNNVIVVCGETGSGKTTQVTETDSTDILFDNFTDLYFHLLLASFLVVRM